MFGPGEVVIPLCLLFIAVRHCPPRWAIGCGVLDAGALRVLPVRGDVTPSSDAMGLEVIALLLVGLVAGLAGHLRSLDYRRAVAVTESRRGEQ
ncbi:hypothetical protein ABZ568_28665 [Streptomyces olindensis]|uniref:Uncharacterized protein n=1 Tax=Streptomyces olindensis TaxID=358823 RepID=A0ABV2Y2N8_9ACTN